MFSINTYQYIAKYRGYSEVLWSPQQELTNPSNFLCPLKIKNDDIYTFFFFTGNSLIILKVSNTNLHNLHINPSIFHLINSGFQKSYFIFMPSYKAKMVVMWKKKNVYNEFTIPIFMNLLY